MAKGVAHAGKGKSLSSGEACENERRGWNEDSYRRKNEKEWNNYDWSRHHLNFEIKDGKIIPLGSQAVSLYDRYLNVLKDIGFKEYKAGSTNQQHTYIELILSGSSDKMQKIAFGDQEVNFKRNPDQWQNWNVKRTTGEGSIEEWAMDVYNFVCNKYNKENIIGFEVHLDETEPHVHVNIVPTAIKQQRGNISGYHKIEMVDGKPKLDDEGNTIPAVYTKGKHIGEMIKISDKKYNDLSDEKKQEYRKNIRGTVRTISFSTYFGDKLSERSQKLSELHDDFYKEIGAKWGFERGDVWANLSDEERRKRMRRTKQQRWLELQAQLAKENAEKEAKEAEEKAKEQKVVVRENDAIIEKQEATIDENNATLENQDGCIQVQETELQKAIKAKDAAVKEKDAAVREMSNAVRSKIEAIEKRDAAIEETNEKQKIIDKQKVTISNNNDVIQKQEKEKAAVKQDIDSLKSVTTLAYDDVRSYIKPLADLEFSVPREVREKLISPLRSHPRITSRNPPLTVKELERIADDLAKAAEKDSWTKTTFFSKFKDIRTDVQTILFTVANEEQKKNIALANRELYKREKRREAVQVDKAVKYDELERNGINKDSYEQVVKERNEAQTTAKRVSCAENILEFSWPGVSKAKNVLIDPALDNHDMTPEQKKDILGCLPPDPKVRLAGILELLKYASSFRDLPIYTKAKAIILAADANIKATATKEGYDLIKDATALVGDVARELEMTVAEAATSAASAALCLFFNYVDGAITVSQGCGGGGGNNDLPKKKDDEDERRFFGRCLNAAVRMMKPKQRQVAYNL